MKIDKLKAYPLAIDRSEVFKIATGSSLTAENVYVLAESGELFGWGNACPNGVTQETTESILKMLRYSRNTVESCEFEVPELWDDIMDKYPKDPSATAGLDIALYDLKGKMEERQIYELRGGKNKGVLTDRTIGIMNLSDTVEHAREFAAKDFKALKIKIGLDLLEDIRRVRAVREVVGKKFPLWVDANQGYSVEEAITLCEKLADIGVEFIEQPVNENDLEGLKRVTEETTIPIMADEPVKDHLMTENICSREIADMINIKLMKCGGLTGAWKIVDVLEDYGVDAMVGCMGEDVPAIAAGVHLCLTTSKIKYADLDSHFMLSDRVFEGLKFDKGKLWLSGEPGLGVEASESKLKKYHMDLEAVV
ncbi:MAG: dipeptide epimerase [Thermoplasmata archaeon]